MRIHSPAFLMVRSYQKVRIRPDPQPGTELFFFSQIFLGFLNFSLVIRIILYVSFALYYLGLMFRIAMDVYYNGALKSKFCKEGEGTGLNNL